MDLTQPCYDSILHIDARLEELQKEVALMEKEYGFKEKHINLVSSTSKSKLSNSKQTKPTPQEKNPVFQETNFQDKKTKSTLKDKTTFQEATRYSNLPSVKVENELTKMKKTKIVPKISQKWKDVFKMKPDNSYFKERSKINSFGLENEEKKTKFGSHGKENIFEEYMQNYASRVLDEQE